MVALQHILIVDDLPDDRLMLITLFKGHGYKAIGAENGQEALEKMAEQDFDLIISDILMPKMDGYRFCLAAKSDERYQKIPFVFYSATFTEDVDEALAKEVGANLFIAKPTDPDQFIAQIKKVIASFEEKEQVEPPLTRTNEVSVTRQYNQSLTTKLAIKAVDLKASELKYKTLFETSQSAVMIYDAEKFIDCNTTCWQLFGCSSRDEFIGTQVIDWSAKTQPDGADSDSAISRHVSLALQQQKQAFEWLHKKQNGDLFPATVELSAMTLDGKLLIQATVHDISRRKRTEQQERLHKEVLKQLLDFHSLDAVLKQIAIGLEQDIQHTQCSILLIGPNDKLFLLAAPSMPNSYQHALVNAPVIRDNCLYGSNVPRERQIVE